jgi:beta-1,4-mannosyltransferase
MRVIVAALGDLGRSPRIQLHAAALARAGACVDFIGLPGSTCWLLGDAPNVSRHLLDDPAPAGSGGRRLWRGVALAAQLIRALARTPWPDAILVQTPPAVPTLWAAALVARLRRTRLIVDWHNLGATLLALAKGARHPVTRLYAAAERRAGRWADGHLCVTAALQARLAAMGIRASLFADRPAGVYRRVREASNGTFRRSFVDGLGGPANADLLAVAPTSFTLDEDLDLLTRAADRLEDQLVANGSARGVVIVATGRGPGRARLEREWNARRAQRARLRTAWLEGEEYPRLLAAADLGLSLHRSSSGADFPMKLLDMRGAGLPACALRFAALGEGFEAGRHGWIFDDDRELAERLCSLAADPTPLASLRAQAVPVESWEEAWLREASPLILGA